MKPIGPYVAARDLTGVPGGEVRTLRATDRLTGMPVLLHVLDRAVALPELPPDPALLPFTDSGVDGGVAYLATELPPHAQPASDPVLTARGALAGLAALHDAGLTHGGVGPAQLWSVDGRVALAGAGLPWGRAYTPEGDLRDLAATLEALGGVPAALRGAPESLGARELLGRLKPPAAPVVLGEAGPGDAQAEPTPPGETAPAGRKAPDRRGAGNQGTWRPDLARPSGEPRAGSPETPPTEPPVVEVSPPVLEEVVPTTAPGAGGDEAPGTRGSDLPRLDFREADLETLAPDPAALAPGQGSFQDTASGEAKPAEPESLIAAAIRQQPAGRAHPGGGTLPRRVVDRPVRIGWEEDHSWRVVKTGGSSRPTARPPRWLGPALAVLAVLLILALLWALLAARAARAEVPPVPQARVAGACCDVQFTVRGAAGVPVRLSVVSAPDGAGVPSGYAVGVAPGRVRLPGPGTYTLRVAAEGYTPGTVTITAPTSQPIAIDLGL